MSGTLEQKAFDTPVPWGAVLPEKAYTIVAAVDKSSGGFLTLYQAIKAGNPNNVDWVNMLSVEDARQLVLEEIRRHPLQGGFGLLEGRTFTPEQVKDEVDNNTEVGRWYVRSHTYYVEDLVEKIRTGRFTLPD